MPMYGMVDGQVTEVDPKDPKSPRLVTSAADAETAEKFLRKFASAI